MNADPQLLAQMYHAIMVEFVRSGRAPHYAELSRDLGLGMEEARQALHQVVNMGLPTWLAPHTDYIASFAPFSSLPTQYLVSIDGQQHGYAQCGFECLAISWLFPGKEVSIECPCLDCGESIIIRMRDGSVLAATPRTIVGHVNLPTWRWRENWADT